MTTKREKIHDKLQFIGLLGPIILLLTLFCTLIKGSPKSGYLFFVTLFSLPALWQWSWRGFWGSLGALLLGLFLFTSFFSSPHSLWQCGAAFSVLLGLFTSFMGFEEIKGGLDKLKVESQSRLDNLIDLDEKFQNSERLWEAEKNELSEELSQLQRRYNRNQEEVHTLEKLVSTLRDELSRQQKNEELLIQHKQSLQKEVSSYESEVLQVKEAYRKIEQTLSNDRSEREKQALEQLELLKQKNQKREQDSGKLQSQIQDLIKEQQELEERALMKDDAFKSMQEALRQKVSTIHELHESIQLKEQEHKILQREIDRYHEELSQKEHDSLTLKDAIKERDLQLQTLNQKFRDSQQDLITARTFLDAKKKELSELQEQFENEGFALQDKLHKQEEEGVRQTEYIAQLENESQQHLETLKQYSDENEQLSSQIEELTQSFESQRKEFEGLHQRETDLKERQFQELKKLNEARFALYQSTLDKERLKNTPQTSQASSKNVNQPKHWLHQLEQLLKGEPSKKINFSKLPNDLAEEILTLHQTKSLYKQLRAQFDEKNEILEETRRELFHVQKDCEEVEKKVDEAIESQLEPEKELHKNLDQQIKELASLEEEREKLHDIISKLIESHNTKTE